MLLIYSHQLSNRLKYSCRLIFGQLLGVDYQLTNNEETFIAHKGPRLNYSYEAFSTEPFIAASELLFQTGIRDQNIQPFQWEGLTVFFSSSRKSVIPFDILAASFYLVSRYEEYLPSIRDEYDRFEAHQSLAYSYGFLRKPIINLWCKKFKESLLVLFPELSFKEKKYRYISTIDIDNAYAYLEKGLMRTAGAYLKDLLKLDFKKITERTKTIFGKHHDPYDTYDYQFSIQKKYNLKTIYFFLVGDYGLNDTNVSIESKKFQSLIKSIADYSEVGVHPSFGSSESPEKFEIEIQRLNRVLHRSITKSRQHFLKLRLPDTYRTLIELDITDDYTMGYAQEIGFRAGICSPFYFYDVDNEVETKLKLHPFAVMDATLKHYMKLRPEQSLEQIKPLIDDVRLVNGTFMSLWHNETLSDWELWEGWQNLYEEVVAYSCNGQ